MSQYVVSLLAQRPEHELRETQDKARAEVERLQVEIELIDQALHRQSRRAPRNGRRTADGGTRSLVLEVFRSHAPEVVAPVKVIAALREDGSKVTAGAIRNMIRRLVNEGEVVKLREGAYKLASRNGSPDEVKPNSGPTENETTEPLSTATGSQVR